MLQASAVLSKWCFQDNVQEQIDNLSKIKEKYGQKNLSKNLKKKRGHPLADWIQASTRCPNPEKILSHFSQNWDCFFIVLEKSITTEENF